MLDARQSVLACMNVKGTPHMMASGRTIVLGLVFA